MKTDLGEDPLPLDVLHEAGADLPVEDVVEEVVEEAAIVLEGLETDLLRNVVGGVRHPLFLDQRQDALSAKRATPPPRKKQIATATTSSPKQRTPRNRASKKRRKKEEKPVSKWNNEQND